MMQAPDWELDYYSRPILEADGKKRWELLICSTPEVSAGDDGTSHQFRWVQTCPATSVNSIWLKEALEQALLVRGHRDFDDRPAYEVFVREAVMRRNRRNAAAFRMMPSSTV